MEPPDTTTPTPSDDENLFDGFTFSDGNDTEKEIEGPNSNNNDQESNEEIISKSRSKGAPKGKNQNRRSHQFTKLLCIVNSRREEQTRRRELPFKLKKRSNSANIHYFQCVTHKDCTYWEMVRRGDSGHGDQRIIFVQEDASHTNEFSSVSKKDGINPRWRIF